MQERRSNADRSRDTRAALLRAGRELFVEKGFAATGTPELVERAGVTRGALYHHFADKQALFEAVVRAESAAISDEIRAVSEDAATPLAALQLGSRAYFSAMRKEGRVRLLLIEGPAVLGSGLMRRIDRETGGLELRNGVQEALAAGVATPRIDALADLVSAMFDRAVLACQEGGSADIYEAAVADLLAVLVQTERGAVA